MTVRDGFKVFFGWNPNQAVARGFGQHVQVTSRDGEVQDFMISDACELAKICDEHEKAQARGVYVRLRRYWGDNSNGHAIATVQVLGPQRFLDKILLKFPETTDEGQSLTVELTKIPSETVLDDHFEPNAAHFYPKD